MAKFNLLGQEGPEGEVNPGAPEAGPFIYDFGPGTPNPDGDVNPGLTVDSEVVDVTGDEETTGDDLDMGSFFDKLDNALNNFGTGSRDAEPDFVPTPQQIEDLIPWLAGKGGLLQEYTNAYIETGNAEFALAAVRGDRKSVV